MDYINLVQLKIQKSIRWFFLFIFLCLHFHPKNSVLVPPLVPNCVVQVIYPVHRDCLCLLLVIKIIMSGTSEPSLLVYLFIYFFSAAQVLTTIDHPIAFWDEYK